MSNRIPSVPVRRVLAGNLRRLRGDLGLSQEALADKCGLHRTYVGAVERSERNVTLATLEALASALGTTPHELITPSRRRATNNQHIMKRGRQ